MRKIKLSPHEIRLFSSEIDGQDYQFFKRHTDAFKRMWEDQGRIFWDRFVICYRAFSINCGVLKEFPVKSEQYEVFIDEAFDFIQHEFVKGKVNQAKHLVCDTAALAHHKGSLGGLESSSYSKDPFYHKETRDIFRRFFGDPKEKSSYIKVYLLLPLYLCFGGSVCSCLRNWLDAGDGPAIYILPSEEDLRPKWAKKDKSNSVADLMQLANPDKSYRVVEDKDEERLILTFLYEQNKRREMGAKTFKDLDEYRKHLYEERMDNDGRISQFVDPKGDGHLIDLSKATEPWWRDKNQDGDKKSKKRKKNKFSVAQQQAARDSMAGETDNGISVCIGTPKAEVQYISKSDDDDDDDDMDVNEYFEKLGAIPKAMGSLSKMNALVEENRQRMRAREEATRTKKLRAVRAHEPKVSKSRKSSRTAETEKPKEEMTVAEYLKKIKSELPPGQKCPFKLTPDGKGACLTMQVTVKAAPKVDDGEKPPFDGWESLVEKLEHVTDPVKQQKGVDLLRRLVCDIVDKEDPMKSKKRSPTEKSIVAQEDFTDEDDPAYAEYLEELRLRMEYMERRYEKGVEFSRKIEHIFMPKAEQEQALIETFKKYGASSVKLMKPGDPYYSSSDDGDGDGDNDDDDDGGDEGSDTDDDIDNVKIKETTEGISICKDCREKLKGKHECSHCKKVGEKKAQSPTRQDNKTADTNKGKTCVDTQKEKDECSYDENLIGAKDELAIFKKNIEGQLSDKKVKLYKMSNEADEKRTGKVVMGMGFGGCGDGDDDDDDTPTTQCEGCASGKHDKDVCAAARHLGQAGQVMEAIRNKEIKEGDLVEMDDPKRGKIKKKVRRYNIEEKKNTLRGKDIKSLVVQRSSGTVSKDSGEGIFTDADWLWKLEHGGSCLNDDGTFVPIRVEARDFAKWFNKEIQKTEEEINNRPYLVCVFTEDEEKSGTMANVMKQLYDMKVEAAKTGGKVSQEGIQKMSKLVHGGMKVTAELKEMDGMKQLRLEEDAKARLQKLEEAKTNGTDTDSENGKKNCKPKNCYGCGKIEPKPKEFKKCQKCQEQKVKQPRYYCGRSCQVKDWTDRHKREHKIWKTVDEPM